MKETISTVYWCCRKGHPVDTLISFDYDIEEMLCICQIRRKKIREGQASHMQVLVKALLPISQLNMALSFEALGYFISWLVVYCCLGSLLFKHLDGTNYFIDG